MASVEIIPSEDAMAYSQYRDYVMDYFRLGIMENFGIPLHVWERCPLPKAKEIRAIAKIIKAEKDKIIQSLPKDPLK